MNEYDKAKDYLDGLPNDIDTLKTMLYYRKLIDGFEIVVVCRGKHYDVTVKASGNYEIINYVTEEESETTEEYVITNYQDRLEEVAWKLNR